jgi:hypothetical protein
MSSQWMLINWQTHLRDILLDIDNKRLSQLYFAFTGSVRCHICKSDAKWANLIYDNYIDNTKICAKCFQCAISRGSYKYIIHNDSIVFIGKLYIAIQNAKCDICDTACNLFTLWKNRLHRGYICENCLQTKTKYTQAEYDRYMC